MSFINDKTKEINCKVVYFGPAFSGKSTTLRHIYGEVKKGSNGGTISLSTDNDRTLYFDFVPLNLGKIKGYNLRLHLYTVPGEAGYKQARSLIAKGVDGVVFTVDSQLERMEDNLKSLANLKEILKNEGHAWGEVPVVFQHNKRDLKNAAPVVELNRYLNAEGSESFATVATKGEGVFETFQAVCRKVLLGLKE